MKWLVGLAIFLFLVLAPKSLAIGPLLPYSSYQSQDDSWLLIPPTAPLPDDDSTQANDDDSEPQTPNGPERDSHGRAYVIRIAHVQYNGVWEWRCWQQYLDQPEPDLSKPYRY